MDKKQKPIKPLVGPLEVIDGARLDHIAYIEGIRVLICPSEAIIFSSLTVDQWKKIREECPALLGINDENGFEIFAVDFDQNPEYPGEILFGKVTFGAFVSPGGYPMIPVAFHEDLEPELRIECIRQYVEPAMMHLGVLESFAFRALFTDHRENPVRDKIMTLGTLL